MAEPTGSPETAPKQEKKDAVQQSPPDILIKITLDANGKFEVHDNVKSSYALLGYLEFAKSVVQKKMLMGPPLSKVSEEKTSEGAKK